MKHTPLISTNENGFYCAQGDFYIDPWRPVPRALVTHAHADHLSAAPYLQSRLGGKIAIGSHIREVQAVFSRFGSICPPAHLRSDFTYRTREVV